jgi:pantetheine-phosphate adenylyltransferase
MKNKAIMTTSANPFHYGHLDIYKKAKRIFDDVTVVVALNHEKTSTLNRERIERHLSVYNIPFEIIPDDCETVADYCLRNNVTHIVRGIRSCIDADYEFKIDFVNREIFPNLQTVLIPTADTWKYVSSSVIRELLTCGREDIAIRYMKPTALIEFIGNIHDAQFRDPHENDIEQTT